MAKGASDTAREKGDEVDLTIGAPLIRCLFAFSMRDIMTAVKKFLRFVFAFIVERRFRQGFVGLDPGGPDLSRKE